jgi:phospholipid/cholesterol/gamma-HCH transport system substrate-binding protein
MQKFKVGIFVVVGLVLLLVAVFFIGQGEHFWQKKETFIAAFKDVAGLKPGSPVELGGVDIGIVSGVGHSHNATDTRIHVKLSIVKSEAVRIREGTVAHVSNKGLLGDKMIELTVPNPDAPELPAGAELQTEEAHDISQYLEKFDQIAKKADKVLENVELATRPFADGQVSEDFRQTVANLNLIVGGIARNDSVAHRLLLDPSEGPKFDRLLTDVDTATAQLGAVLNDAHDVTTQVRQGPGLAHAVVYDGEMSKGAAAAVDELHKDLAAIREGNGLAHALLYGDDNSQHVMGNLNAMSDDLRQIVASIREGKGTIGGLLVDPSIYEDIKSAVGNVERNQVLRALVRYSIKADEQHPQPRVSAAPR